jgi:hypothetical protein
VYKESLHKPVTFGATGKYVRVMGAGRVHSTAKLYLLHYTTVVQILSIHAHLVRGELKSWSNLNYNSFIQYCNRKLIFKQVSNSPDH